MVIERGFELAGQGVGRGTALLGSAWRFPGQMLAAGGSRRDPDVGRLGALPFDEARHLVASDGGHIFTTAHGSGPTFLFVHGFAMTSRVWTKQFRDLPAAGMRAIAFDHRGHGASTATMDETSVDNLADDVRVVVEGLDLRDAVVVGHSMGGGVALGFVLAHPERVRSLILMDTLSGKFEIPDDANKLLEVAGKIAREHGMETLYRLTRAASESNAKTPPAVKRCIETMGPELYWARAHQKHLAMDPVAFTARGAALVKTTGVTDRLCEIACPTTVIVGAEDEPFLAPSELMAERIAGARKVVIENAAHCPQVEAPDAWRAAVDAHLDWARRSAPFRA